MKLNTREIRDLACKIIAENPGGIRYSELQRMISQRSPETSLNAISGSIWNLHQELPQIIAKPSRGLFVPIDGRQEPPAPRVKLNETSFYEPFAEWLKNDLDEVTDVTALGGASLHAKWGTPDVVGVYRPLTADLIKFTPEVISAEIKVDPQQPVVAFGQAVAYRLFSTKTYIAMPHNIGESDLSRLEALCMLFGVGLVLFNADSTDNPAFGIRVRAQRFYPDMFYVNEFAESLKKTDRGKFEKLFH